MRWRAGVLEGSTLATGMGPARFGLGAGSGGEGWSRAGRGPSPPPAAPSGAYGVTLMPFGPSPTGTLATTFAAFTSRMDTEFS